MIWTDINNAKVVAEQHSVECSEGKNILHTKVLMFVDYSLQYSENMSIIKSFEEDAGKLTKIVFEIREVNARDLTGEYLASRTLFPDKIESDPVEVGKGGDSLCEDPFLNSMYDGKLRFLDDHMKHLASHYADDVWVGNDWHYSDETNRVAGQSSLECKEGKPYVTQKLVRISEEGIVLETHYVILINDEVESGKITLLNYSEKSSDYRNLTEDLRNDGTLYLNDDE